VALGAVSNGKLAEVEGEAISSFPRRWGAYPMVEACLWQWDLALGFARSSFQRFHSTGSVSMILFVRFRKALGVGADGWLLRDTHSFIPGTGVRSDQIPSIALQISLHSLIPPLLV
jgi:hypothetical protein